MDIKTTNRTPTREPLSRSFDRVKVDWTSLLMTVATGFCVVLILAMLAVILAYIGWHGADAFSLRFISSGVGQDMFDAKQTGVLPMILGTCARVMLMTLFVMPMGVITAVYLTEYAPPGSRITRILRGAVNNLAGVPSIVFGLFGLGFFISFVGGGLDNLFNADATAPHFRSPALIWASLTLAIMTMPVVIVATEESLRSIPQGLRSASLALGATKLQTITRVVLPQALPGILTGDPRRFDQVSKMDHISYREAIEMTYYGAQVIHPKTIKPLQNKHIPLLVKSFVDPEGSGTVISTDAEDAYPPIVSVEEDQALIRISTKDFSFVAEHHMSFLFKHIADIRLQVNLMQNTAISFVICVNDVDDKVEQFAKAVEDTFKVNFERGLDLFTVRHYNDAILNNLKQGKIILAEEKMPKTTQFVTKTVPAMTLKN